MSATHATLIPLMHGGELLVAHRHTGGLLLAQRTGRAGNFRVDVIGVVAAEEVEALRAALASTAPVAAPLPARSAWHATNPAEVARCNPVASSDGAQADEPLAVIGQGDSARRIWP